MSGDVFGSKGREKRVGVIDMLSSMGLREGGVVRCRCRR